jgi:hypothetical protein
MGLYTLFPVSIAIPDESQFPKKRCITVRFCGAGFFTSEIVKKIWQSRGISDIVLQEQGCGNG